MDKVFLEFVGAMVTLALETVLLLNGGAPRRSWQVGCYVGDGDFLPFGDGTDGS